MAMPCIQTHTTAITTTTLPDKLWAFAAAAAAAACDIPRNGATEFYIIIYMYSIYINMGEQISVPKSLSHTEELK